MKAMKLNPPGGGKNWWFLTLVILAHFFSF
jgi:hypothetical protein